MKPTLRVLTAAIGWLAVMASVIGLMGGLLWTFDLLSHFRLQYLLVLTAAAVAMALLGSRRVAVVFALAAVFNLALIAPLYLRSQPEATGDDRLEVVSFNMQLSNPTRQLPWILSHDPDVVIFFESSRLAEEQLREMDIGYEVTSGIADHRRFGITVLTREPIDLERLPFLDSEDEAVRFEMPLGDDTVAVYGIHPPSPSKPWRSVARNEFMQIAGERIADEDLPVVVAGDFNATPWSEAFRLLTGPADLRNSQEGFGYAGTWPATLWPVLRIPIDHLVYKGDLTVVEREVGPVLNADHRPLRVVVAPAASD